MSYLDDPNMNRPRGYEEGGSVAAWIIGGLVAVAVLFGIFFMVTSNETNVASTSPNPPAAGAPAPAGATPSGTSTTGSAR